MKIKKELEKDWKETRLNNTKDSYSAIVVVGALIVGEALDEGRSSEEAHNELLKYDLGITGFQAGGIAYMVSKYHERGEEFKTWWNSQYSSEPREGVINPALVTIESE